MKTTIRRAAAAAVAMTVLLAGSSGCASSSPKTAQVTMSEEEILSTLSYKATEVDIPDDVVLGGTTYFVGDTYYTAVGRERPSGGATIKSVVFTAFDEEEVKFSTVLLENADDPGAECSLLAFTVTEDGTAYVACSYGGSTLLFTVSPAGEELSRRDMTAALEGRQVTGMVTLPTGEFVFSANNADAVVTDSQGELVFSAQSKDGANPNNIMGSDVFLNSRGEPVISYGYMNLSEGDFQVKAVPVDMKKRKFGKQLSLEGSGSFFSGRGDYLYYESNDTGIVGVYADGKTENVINLLNIGVDPSVATGFTACKDGSFLLNISDYTDERQRYLMRVTPAEGTSERTVLNLACFELPFDYQSKIAEFNRTNDEYLVVAASYSDGSDSDEDAALTEFNNQLISGNIPDIVLLNEEMPIDSYIRKNMFTDLYPFMDEDSEVSRDSYLENVLKSCEKDGKLYSIYPTFYITTFGVRRSVAGEDGLLTMDRAEELVAGLSPDAKLTIDMSRDDALKNAMDFCGCIDFGNGTCDFDNDEFKRLLNVLKDIPVQRPQVDSVEKGRAWLDNKALVERYFIIALNYYRDNMKLLFGDDISFVSFPTVKPAANAVIVPSERMAISSKCEDKEGAWEFVKFALTDNLLVQQQGYTDEEGVDHRVEGDYYCYCIGGFPTVKEEFDRLVEYALTPAHEYESDGTYVLKEETTTFAGAEVKLETMSEADVKLHTDLIASTTHISRINNRIYSIIEEEAKAFFDGASTVDQCAANIQSRVSLYLDEQYN
ncbi:MAG: extracellular solute-binding protein [Oscillospiraceae bacterium]|nr:extracellular solute-binding protein [Oscillospiraceae bacterium]